MYIVIYSLSDPYVDNISFSGCKKSQFYSLPFGKAVVSIY